jgi:hypothetical protein
MIEDYGVRVLVYLESFGIQTDLRSLNLFQKDENTIICSEWDFSVPLPTDEQLLSMDPKLIKKKKKKVIPVYTGPILPIIDDLTDLEAPEGSLICSKGDLYIFRDKKWTVI